MKPYLHVVCGVLRHAGKILISQRKQGVHLAEFWEFPGGKRHEGESDREALIREFREELGLKIAPGELLHEVVHDYETRTVALHFYACQTEQKEPTPRALEVADFRWVLPGELSHYRFPPANDRLLEQLTELA